MQHMYYTCSGNTKTAGYYVYAGTALNVHTMHKNVQILLHGHMQTLANL